MDLDLVGRHAIVTGGSAGIGRAIARQLALEGVAVAVCSRSLDRAKAAIEAMGVAEGGQLLPVVLELRDRASVTRMVAEAVEAFGGVDILVNSASEVSGNVSEAWEKVTEELVLSSFEDKFLGILRCCRAVVPHMRAQQFGRIINVAGHKAREGGAVAAGARNAAVVNLTKAISLDVGRDGITVNTVHPYTTVTERLESRMARMGAERGLSAAEQLAQRAERTSLGRLLTAEEIANFVTFLASPRSVALTGEVVALTGGVGDAVYY
jgi:NAD(P)-dependent dehydrogenase (short-subunit alcohol dehydrogenase family)